ncbi:MAG: MFS transporter [bacterium]
MLRRIYVIAFLFCFHSALTAYVNSSIAQSLVGEKLTGILYATASLCTLVCLSFFPRILHLFGNRKTFISLLSLTVLLLITLSQIPSQAVGVVALIAYIVINTLVFFSLDVFIEHWSTTVDVGKIRGLYLMISNIGWMFAPLFSSRLAGAGLPLVYLGASSIVFLAVLLSIFLIKNYDDKNYTRKTLLETLRTVIKRTTLWPIIALNFLLQFFFSWMVIYTPLYLREVLHLSWEQLGIIFSIMLSAFVLVQYPIGRFIDKGASLRLILTGGFVVILGATATLPFVTQDNLVFLAIVLFLTRVGAATIEVCTDTYFFRQITDSDTHILSLYRDMSPFAYVIGPITATTLLYFKLPLVSLFFILSSILALSFIFIPLLTSSKVAKTETLQIS